MPTFAPALLPEGRFRSFLVYDPKERRILAPCFRDRVAHHALMRHLGPVLDRALVDDTFACRPGKGTLAAVHRAQRHLRRHPWFVKTDIRSYFASVDHATLLGLLERHFERREVIERCASVLARTPDGSSGRGLPIGALTSQHFANTYLAGLDRLLLEGLRVRAMVRYMDDTIWWCRDRAEARQTRDAVVRWLREQRHLTVKDSVQIGRSEHGVTFLGFRILRGSLRLSLRRRRRFRAAHARWERAYQRGEIDELTLQARADSALAITAHADAVGWRRAYFRDRPPLEV